MQLPYRIELITTSADADMAGRQQEEKPVPLSLRPPQRITPVLHVQLRLSALTT